MQKKQKGFTLIELLVVIAIIGLLSTLAVVALNSARMKSRDARRLSDVKQIQTALELYYNDQGEYPPADPAVRLGDTDNACLDTTGFTTEAACLANPYMAVVPEYPSPRTDNNCTDATAGYDYLRVATDQSTYRLNYCLGGAAGGVGEGVQIGCESGISGCN